MSQTHPANDKELLVYQQSIGNQKPFTVREHGPVFACPFCDHSQLPPIIKQDGDILLVPNKYPILRNTDPYVLIETSICDSELSLYSQDHLVRVFSMAFDLWHTMLTNPAFRSVLFMKNHGPFSGGSIRHPHMQLIGLHDVDALAHIQLEDFLGPIIEEESGVQLTVSSSPRVGFVELNVILRETGSAAFPVFCMLIQKAVRYILRHFHDGLIDSYNLFFYYIDETTYCKIMPRSATTPIFVGYSIAQVVDDLASIVEDYLRQDLSV